MAPVREYMREHRGEGKRMAAVDASQFRAIRTDDFFGRRSGHAPVAAHGRKPGQEGI